MTIRLSANGRVLLASPSEDYAASGAEHPCLACGTNIHVVPGSTGPVWAHTATGFLFCTAFPTPAAIEALSDQAGICRECGEDLPEDLLRMSIDYHPECAGVAHADPCTDPGCAEHGVAASNRRQSEFYADNPRTEARE